MPVHSTDSRSLVARVAAKNPLVDILTPKVRRIAYTLLSIAATAFTVYQATGGDWAQVVSGVVTALFGATAASNTKDAPSAAPPAA